MRDILSARLSARNKQTESSVREEQHMQYQQLPKQPGRIICESLISLKEEIIKIQPSNQTELTEAVDKLWMFRGCDKMS